MFRKCVALCCAVVGAFGLTSAVTTASGAAAGTCPTGIASTVKLVNDYWIAHNPNPKGLSWTTGAYFAGDMAAARALSDQTYLSYAQKWAQAAKFRLKGGAGDTDANDQAVGQTYIELYQQDPAHPAADIAQIDQSVRTMVNRPAVDDWWWIDALFMAMPDFAKLSAIKNDPSYSAKMYALFHDTKQTRGLWNAGKGLWWRDASFVGKNVYWSRGNGWALAALARVLDVLPTTDPHRAEYVQTLQQQAAALKAAQQPDGFWYVNLGDRTEDPGPETSGTAFFTYGIAWGIEHGLLDSATYLPVVTKAWQAMAKLSVRSSGFLGYVQGVGSAPAPVSADSTADYGVGAFLLAGSELTRLCAPVR